MKISCCTALETCAKYFQWHKDKDKHEKILPHILTMEGDRYPILFCPFCGTILKNITIPSDD